MKIRILAAVLFVAALPAVCSIAFAQKISAISSANHAAAETLAGIPLSFEPNHGQSDASVKFLSHGNGYSLFLTDSGAVLVLSKQESRSKLAGHSLQAGDVIRMELQGAKSKVDVHGVDELPGKANYFIGNDPTKWRAGVSTYARVKYSEVYPGVILYFLFRGPLLGPCSSCGKPIRGGEAFCSHCGCSQGSSIGRITADKRTI
jgi:hypothetical protein